MKDGANTNELYELEAGLHNALTKVVEWREKHFQEKYWEEALPQTLLAILEFWDKKASKIAIRCFLEVPANNYGEGIEEKAV